MDRKTAIVTGGGRGIGRAVAISLAKAGMNVVINYAGNDAAAEETVELCNEAFKSLGNDGAEAIAIKADVSVKSGVDELFAAVKEQFGGVDVLVNNAGVTRDGLIIGLKEEDFDVVMNTNLKGAFLCSQAAAKMMIRKRAGVIINLSSVVGLHGNAGQSNYSASKAGIIGLTKSLAKELSGRNIRVNAVAPGFIDTDMTKVLSEDVKEAMKKEIPLGDMGSPEDIACAVAFLVSDGARYITGQVLSVDGGMSM